MWAGSAAQPAQAARCLCSPSHLEGEPSGGLGLPLLWLYWLTLPVLTGIGDRCRSCLELVEDLPACEQEGHEALAGHCSASSLAASTHQWTLLAWGCCMCLWLVGVSQSPPRPVTMGTWWGHPGCQGLQGLPLGLRVAALWVVWHCLSLSIGNRHTYAMVLHASATRDNLLKQVAVCAPAAKSPPLLRLMGLPNPSLCRRLRSWPGAPLAAVLSGYTFRRPHNVWPNSIPCVQE